MIFDRFPNAAEATVFVQAVIEEYGLTCHVYATADAAQEADPIPAVLHPPVVHVERSGDASVDQDVEQAVTACGGRFVGT